MSGEQLRKAVEEHKVTSRIRRVDKTFQNHISPPKRRSPRLSQRKQNPERAEKAVEDAAASRDSVSPLTIDPPTINTPGV